jgi:hypothetical protein
MDLVRCEGIDLARINRADPRWRHAEPAFVVLVGLLFVLAIGSEVDGFNGPAYCRWPWQHYAMLRSATLLALPLPLFIAALYLIERKRRARFDTGFALSLLTLVNFCLQIAGMYCHAGGLSRLVGIVESAGTTSYFTDASAIQDVGTWLAGFDSADLHFHSLTHPPGPILFHYFWQTVVGPPWAAAAAGISIGVIAACAIPLVYGFAGLWTDDRKTRLLACAHYSLLPALVVFLPELDQIYPIVSMVIALGWVLAIRSARVYAVLLGVALFAASMLAYNLLATGAFMLLFGAVHLAQQHGRAQALGNLLAAAALAMSVFLCLHGLLWLLTGYDAPASFLHALKIQGQLVAWYKRPWWPSVFFDLYDFFLGSGMLALPLLILFFRGGGAFRQVYAQSPRTLAIIALASIFIVDVSGLLRCEASRVWLFLQPFAIVPAAFVLGRFDWRARAAVFALQWFIIVVLISKISFVS